jgi:uncharacterized protein YutE (UPF0331/DUF86 family)
VTDADLITKKLAFIETCVRNILVHGYQSVDTAILLDIVENRLGDLLAFVSAVRARLSAV